MSPTLLLAQTRATLQFDSAKAQLPAVGIMLPILRSAQQTPLKGQQVYRYTMTRGAESWQEDRYDPYALWLEAQYGAGWVDRYNNAMHIASMTHLPPPATMEQHVAQDTFLAHMDNPNVLLDEHADTQALTDWMAVFSGQNIIGAPVVVPVNRSRLAQILEFKTEDSGTRAYAFRLNTRYPGQAKAPANWFAITLTLNQPNLHDVDATIRTKLLAEIATMGGFDGTAARSVKNRTRKETTNVREHASRTAARKSVEMLPEWWYMDSENYIMLSNDPKAERFAIELLDNLEKMRPFFEKYVPAAKTTIDTVSVIRFFKTEQEYFNYLSDVTSLNVRNTGGVFSSSRRELVIRPVNLQSYIDNIVKHEGFHQYLFTAYGGIPTSVWFNEGHATFFENCDVDSRGRLVINESRRYADALERIAKQRDVDWAAGLQAFLRYDHKRFYAAPDTNYPLAYGLIYFLRLGAPDIPNKPYADILPVYMETLTTTGNPDTATTAAFKNVDMKRFAADFTDFWKSSQKRQRAKRNAQ